MKLTIHHIYLLLMLVGLHTQTTKPRSIHRKEHASIPQITVGWAGNPKAKVSLRNSHLEEYPLFKLFDKNYFDTNVLPDGPIPYRHEADKATSGSLLKEHLEVLLKEIKAKKKSYAHFMILTGKNFNRHKRVGMIILRYKYHPIIVKLSIETPASFIDPFCKGLDNIWFFPMGGGINRHLAGLTRVKNRENVKKKLLADQRWSSRIDVPRKWYWLPKNPRWLKIEGTNIGPQKTQSGEIPGTYAIIADAIDIERELELNNKEDTDLALDLCNYLEHAIDAHINNFVVEKNTGTIIIIDTEHFPSVVGIKEKVQINSYLDWYSYLIRKCGNDWFFRTKKERLAAQARSRTILLI